MGVGDYRLSQNGTAAPTAAAAANFIQSYLGMPRSGPLSSTSAVYSRCSPAAAGPGNQSPRPPAAADVPEYSVPRKVVPNFALEKLDMGEIYFKSKISTVDCFGAETDFRSHKKLSFILRFHMSVHLLCSNFRIDVCFSQFFPCFFSISAYCERTTLLFAHSMFEQLILTEAQDVFFSLLFRLNVQ
jgi:hypothetical protein